ncbi:exonuclease domain-containing protein [Aestuariibacter sp. AA17]|uniref:DNA-directed DNA polymerase n=1 Tax=Fluctibacter corallii TaxID=2984329 RepID=A0ABT3A439_9ALTE|nr:exonuclease domain-containing protein [Aestuariibacter sp. AA17]MCV2883367.1 exonuclease domain-containing protein [Aestuariibacter sp. AA17]
MKTLPEKYYLAHFHEFLTFVKGTCQHLLCDGDRHFIAEIERLSEDAKCVLIRAMNRKSPFILKTSLDYNEIAHYDIQIQTLLSKGFFSRVTDRHLPSLFEHLTKPQLSECLRVAETAFKISDKKPHLIELATHTVAMSHFVDTSLYQQLIVRETDSQMAYLLFLFFGDISSGLNKFSMRDLGIMRTRKGEQGLTARYDTQEEALSAFDYALALRSLATLPDDQVIDTFSDISTLPLAKGEHAIAKRDRFLLKLGKRVLPNDPDLALTCWQASSAPEAQEKAIREEYKRGNQAQVLAQLNDIIDNPDSEEIALFAEDFLARKFNKKRTSYLTDMLREDNAPLFIDEIYINRVETGVKKYYQQRGSEAYKTENRLWRTLFGLTFWQELFELDETALANEFDRRPRALVQRYFYDRYQQEIERKLALLHNIEAFRFHLTKTASTHYGKSNGIFNWHPKGLEIALTLVKYASADNLISVLRAMTKQFYSYNDGFPDLMIITDHSLRFEEIKAPGDQLRKNQLITIRMLRDAGFNVGIKQVNWHIDPHQAYAVVDIETTGGRAAQHRITEIGIVHVVNGKKVSEWQTLINPQRHIPKHITELTGIDNAMVANAPRFADIADTLQAQLKDCVFVAHNVNFDFGFIKQEYERLNLPFRMPKLCTVKEMRSAYPGLSSYSLANLTAHFDIDMKRHHRALSDAHAAADLLLLVNEYRLQHYKQNRHTAVNE